MLPEVDQEETAPPAETVASVPVETEAVPDREQIAFTDEDAAQLEIRGGCTYDVNVQALLEAQVALDFSGDEPRVLIVHTHATESYAMEPGWEYEESALARTTDPDYNVVRVGREIAAVLEAAGIGVIHDETLNDYPSYDGAYERTLERIEAHLAEHPTIQMVLDVHRDAAENPDGTQMATAGTVNGQPSAQLMLVVGTDEGGLWHPQWQRNLSWALKLQALSERENPGLCRPLNLRTGRFNQHAAPGSVLLEVGTAGNTLQEALLAARAFAETVLQVVDGLNLR